MNVFISYRRDDTGLLSYDLYKRLMHSYGKDAVFLDVSSIPPGEDFQQLIDRFIIKCDLMLAIIGKQWLNASDGHGRKLDNPDDLLRRELELALTNDVLILPVLVDDTPVPSAHELPVGLRRLPRIQVYQLRTGEHLDRSVQGLHAHINELVASKREKVPDTSHPHGGYVLAVGGGNGEYTLTPNSPYREGGKHSVRSRPLYGGSGMNYSAKLMGYRIPTLPILSIGNDELGREIRAELLRICSDAALHHNVSDWIKSNDFFVPNARTPRSTIVVEGGRRTIFKEALPPEHRGDFLAHLRHSLDALQRNGIVDHVKAVIIGHIQADEPTGEEIAAMGRGRVPGPGRCTECIVDFFSKKGVPIFANFGESQLRRGHEAWQSVLDKLEVFQLNADELVRFFGASGELDKIVQGNEVRKSAYCVVTMDKFGALCVGNRERMRGLVVAWSSRSQRVVDTTGAGDAFLSGLLSYAFEFPDEFSRRQGILRPMARGRVWAESTCQHLGGASETPDAAKLRDFESSRDYADPNAIDEAHAGTILQILATAYNQQPT